MNRYESLKEFYSGKKVYITGITGFKGTWLALMLNKLGAYVEGVGLPGGTPTSNLMHIDKFDNINIIYADIIDERIDNPFYESLKEFNPDVVFHLAAQPLVSDGYKRPYNTFKTNILGTVILHELLNKLNKKISLINITTDKVYKAVDKEHSDVSNGLTEENVLQGYDPYSLSKSCSDMISQCYQNALYNQVITSTMRAGNVIGGGDFSDNRIVTDLVNAVKNKTVLELRNPNAVRPYQHVFDALLAYLTVAMLQYKTPGIASEYNVGPDKENIVDNQTLVKEFQKYFDFDVDFNGKFIGEENPYLALNADKIRKFTPWSPVYNNLHLVVKSTAEWYNNYIYKHNNVTAQTMKQIREGFLKYAEE